MKKILKANTDEREWVIVGGILVFYLLIFIFLFFLFSLNRISLNTFLVILILFTIIYLPRFLIIYKIKNKDVIKIVEDKIQINNQIVNLNDINDYKFKENKPIIIFVYNNKIIIYKKTDFQIQTTQGIFQFSIMGEEKKNLLIEFLNNLLDKH